LIKKILFLLFLSACSGKQIIENTNRAKNIKNLSTEGIKEEIYNKTKKTLEQIGR
tara:strand:- start:2611 stop:2775 length:165 start_codon:yes stop_codon:yes gene_type:complete